MSDRYHMVFRLSPRLYLEGSPVLIEAGAIQKDTQTNNLLVQLKFKNISSKIIIACKVKVDAYSVSGDQLEGVDSFSYLDLNVYSGEEFGTKTPIFLPSYETRKFSVNVTQIVFLDNSVWNSEGGEWQQIDEPIKVECKILEEELVKQYKIEVGDMSDFYPENKNGLFYCTCGNVNADSAERCYYCKRKYSELVRVLDEDSLIRNADERHAREEKEREQRIAEQHLARQKELEEKQKRLEKLNNLKKITIKVAIGLLVCSVIAVGICFVVTKVIPDHKYNKAMRLHDLGDYDSAINLFVELNGYRDSQHQIVVCTYDKAMQLISEANYNEGYQLLDSVRSDYDVDTIITETEYSRGISSLDEGDYSTAIAFFEDTIDYEDSESRIDQCYYGLGIDEYNNENYSEAINYFTLSNDYGDSGDYLRNSYDIMGNMAFDEEDYCDALLWYEQSGNESQLSECNYQLAEECYAQGDYLSAANYYEAVSTRGDLSAVIQESYYSYLVDAIAVEGQSPAYYTQLIGVLNSLDPNVYVDVDDMTTEVKYRRALAYMEDGSYAAAVDEFESLGNYEDSNSLEREAMYQYVLANRNNGNYITYQYLTELRSNNYQDSRSIYDELYSWSVEVRGVTGENTSTTQTRFSRYNNFYFYVEVLNGPPEGQVTLHATLTFPDGSTSTTYWDSSWGIGWSGNCWFWYNNPSYGATGSATLRVYDSSNNLLGQTTVTIY